MKLKKKIPKIAIFSLLDIIFGTFSPLESVFGMTPKYFYYPPSSEGPGTIFVNLVSNLVQFLAALFQ